MSEEIWNLIEIFDSLRIAPIQSTTTLFSANKIPNRQKDFIAKGREGQPVLLIAVPNEAGPRLPPITMEYLTVDHGLECRVEQSNGSSELGIFSVIQCINADRLLQEYFLRAVAPVIQSLPLLPLYREIGGAINSLVELFQKLSQPGKKSIRGLWAELYLISIAINPIALIGAWHSAPGDIFDFNSGLERIEVKSSSERTRLHFFSFDQLYPPGDAIILIVSIFVEEAGNGQSVFDLVEKTKKRTCNKMEVARKIDQVVSETLGLDWRHAAGMRFDMEIATSSLSYYLSTSIPCVPGPLPLGVSQVRFRADLSFCTPIDLDKMISGDNLFKALPAAKKGC